MPAVLQPEDRTGNDVEIAPFLEGRLRFGTHGPSDRTGGVPRLQQVQDMQVRTQ